MPTFDMFPVSEISCATSGHVTDWWYYIIGGNTAQRGENDCVKSKNDCAKGENDCKEGIDDSEDEIGILLDDGFRFVVQIYLNTGSIL